MLKAKKAPVRVLSAIALIALPVMAIAQNYYDDDIYYNPAKDTKKTEKKTASQAHRSTSGSATAYPEYEYPTVADFPAADTYVVNTGSTRDVDEYNRGGQFLVSDDVVADTILDTYSNTRKIQKYHNSDIINTLNNDDYATYVVTDPAQVNIYVNTPYYGYDLYPYWRTSWYLGWHSPWWSLSWGIYDPWYWGPSWSWGWGYDWCYRPGWGHGWGPGWGHSWGPGWGHGPGWGSVAARPTPSGSSRPHNYAGAGASTTHRGQAVRPVNTASSSSARPGNGGYGTRPGNGGYGAASASSSRPGSVSGSQGAPSKNNGSTGTISTNRGRNNGSASTTKGSSSSQKRSNASSSSSSGRSSSSSGSYNRGSSGSSHSSGSSMGHGGGSRGGGGGSHGGGGGGGRGRR